MQADTSVTLPVLRVDGGMTGNNLLMQLLADITGVPVERQLVAETVSLGAAYGAGLATGFWPTLDHLPQNITPAGRWMPSLEENDRERQHRRWRRAVESAIMWDVDD